MSLINCPKCKKQISDAADECPSCKVRFRPRLTPIKEDIVLGKRVVKIGFLLALSFVVAIAFAIFTSYLQTPK